ncbi:hypothetical protein LINPERHAP1_LOCUS15872, partial [Linum perenne]
RLGSYCGVTIVLNFRFQLTLLGWSCEVKIRKLLWSDHCFKF